MKNNKAVNKKAQIEMGETIAVIIIVTIMIFFGLAFYTKIKTLDLKDQTDKFNQFDAVKLANIVSNMPEILCSKQQVIDINCVDKYKLLALNQSIADDEAFFYYRSILQNSRISVEQLYPDKINYSLYENNMTANQSIETISIPVNIYDPITRKNAFGVLKVEAYS